MPSFIKNKNQSLLVFGTVVKRAKSSNQRRMVVTDSEIDAKRWAETLSGGIEVGWESLKIPNMKFLHISDSKEALGKTYENLLIDMRSSFSANDIGRLIPAVKGGGVIIILTPKLEVFSLSTLNYHKHLAILPRNLSACRHLFIPRLIKKFYEHEGIWIHRNGRWEKESRDDDFNVKKQKISFPKTKLPKELMELCLTQNQIDALTSLETSKHISVLTADRGRGKSALLGMFIAGFRAIRNKKTEIIVTAPSRDKVEIVFEFIEKALKKLKIPFVYKNEILLGKQIKVTYVEPKYSVFKKADLFIVDEAAGIPIHFLKKLSEKERVVFSTTVHGYEGSGRIFSYRFMKQISEHIKIQMDEPIRYAKNDLIENWLFDTLLLDAEPEEADKKELKIKRPSVKELFFDEKLLRSFFGLLVSAHYKNMPNDLMTLADAPHHFVQLTLSENKLIGAVQLAYEGELSRAQADDLFENESQKGNLIPDIFSKHYIMKEFARLKGVRIIRIVTNPNIQSKGVGSFSLKSLEDLELDWLGASFGAESRLVKFWVKNGYTPVAISPLKNRVTGEYSLVVVKPLSDKSCAFVSRAHEQFINKFIEMIGESSVDLSSGVIREILKCVKFPRKIKMGDTERKRIELFINGKHSYLLDVDLIQRLTKYYFLTGQTYLKDKDELILISRCFQKKIEKNNDEKIRVMIEEIYKKTL